MIGNRNYYRRIISTVFVITIIAVFLISTTDLHAGSASKDTGSMHKAENVMEPKLLAVKFHADWCGSCKAMGPVHHDLMNKYDGKPVLFVVFDLTNGTTRNQSELLASALGLSNVWEENGGKTGTIKLIDPKTKKVVSTLTKEHDIKQMGASIDKAL